MIPYMFKVILTTFYTGYSLRSLEVGAGRLVECAMLSRSKNLEPTESICDIIDERSSSYILRKTISEPQTGIEPATF